MAIEKVGVKKKRLTGVVLVVLVACGSVGLRAQAQPPLRADSGHPLILNQTHYHLHAGERVQIAAPLETLEFLRNAKSRTLTIGGVQGKGLVVGPDLRGDKVLLAASLTMKPGDYAVTVSAVSGDGEERTAAANIRVEALPVVPSGGSTPPVVLLNGWQFSVLPPSTCPIAPTGPVATFGSLASQLVAPQVYFFDNCIEQSVNGSSIEELSITLGQFLNMIQYAGGALVPQVDLVSHSMGGLIVRSYLAGLQANDGLSPVLNPRVRKFIEIATPNFGSFLAANYSDALASGTQAAEMVPGSGFLWSLGTWNQRGDDLRGVDALAIIGNAGYWKSSILALTQLNDVTDGVVSLTSASLNFARDPSRTKILPYCHIDSASFAGAFIDCTGKGIADVDEAPETGVIVLSFLANSTAWESEGYANQTQFAGGYFALENAAGTQYTAFSSVLLGSQSFETGADMTNTIFYNEFVNVGTGTFQATSTTNQATTCGPFTVKGGYYSIFRCKFSPAISSVGPLLTNVAARVVASGGSITISGVGFGQQCSACQVLVYPGPIALQVSSWSDSSVAALLPSTYNGITEVVVQAASGSDSITFMAAPPALPPTISLSNTQLQFLYTVGGVSPTAQTVTVANSGGGTFTWSAESSVSWLTFSSAPGLLTVSVNPAGLSPNKYTATITITAAGASNNPQTVSVTLTVTAPPLAAPSISLSASHVTFTYTMGGPAPSPQMISVSNSGGGILTWSTTPSASWITVSSASNTLSISVNPNNLFAGSYTGTISVTAVGASNSPQTITVSLTVIAAQTPVTIAAVVNGASFATGYEPGSWVSITGTSLATDSRTWKSDEIVNGQLPTSLDGTSVTINGLAAFVYFISPTQLNVLAPSDSSITDGQSVPVKVMSPLGTATGTAVARLIAPAMFKVDAQDAAAINLDGTIVAPIGAFPGSHPAKPGDVVELYLTGLGPTNPAITAGQLFSAAAPITNSASVQVGGVSASVLFAGLVTPGLYQVNLTVPEVGDGNQALTLQVGTVASQNSAVLAVQH